MKSKKPVWYYVFVVFLLSILFSPSIEIGKISESRSFELKITDILLVIFVVVIMLRILLRRAISISDGLLLIAGYFIIYIIGVITYFGMFGFARSPLLYLGKHLEYLLLCYAGYFVVIRNKTLTSQLVASLSRMMAFSFILNVLFMIYQVATSNYFGVKRAFEHRASVLFDPAIGASGQFMVLSFLFLLYHKRMIRIVSGNVDIIMLIICILFSLVAIGSTGAVISFISMLIARYILDKKVDRLLAAVRAGAFLTLFVMVLLTIKKDIAHQVSYIMERLNRVVDVMFTGEVSTIGNRYYAWSDFIAKFVKNPLIGTGTSSAPMVDNQYLKILVEFGVFGLIIFLTVFYLLLKKYFDYSRRFAGSALGNYSTFMFLATIALLAHSLSSDILQPVRIMEPYWFLSGIYWGIRFLYRSGVVDEEFKPSSEGTVYAA